MINYNNINIMQAKIKELVLTKFKLKIVYYMLVNISLKVLMNLFLNLIRKYFFHIDAILYYLKKKI